MIFRYSLSSIQALQAGRSKTRPDKINNILKGHVIHKEWIPSHVGIPSNELADITAKDAMQNGIEDKTKPAKSEVYTIINKL